MKKNSIKFLMAIFSLLLVITMVLAVGSNAEAAAKPKLKKKTSSIVIGGTYKIKLKNVPKTAKVSYKSKKASIAKVSKDGKVTGKKGGTTKIIITVKYQSKTTKLTYKITVKKPSLKKNKISLKKGESISLVVKNKPKNAKYTWTSSNKKIVTVNKKGKVTAKKNGTATVKVKVKTTKKTYTLSTKVTVKSQSDERRSYTILFDSNGGSDVASQIVREDDCAVNPTDPMRNGYTFDGWYTDATGGKKFDFSTPITGDVTLYAHWTEIKHTVTFFMNDGTDTVYISVDVSENTSVAAPAEPTRDNHTFVGWYTDPATNVVYDFQATVVGNLNLYAKWTSPAIEYLESNAELIKTVDAKKSDEVMAEKDVKSLLESRGFGGNPISYSHSIDGVICDETNVEDASMNVHPMYQTVYNTQNGEAWAVYVINGSIFASPISFNFGSDLYAQLLVSESETLTSYDDVTNQFFVTIPHPDEVIVHSVGEINSGILDRLTIEEICNLTGASYSAFTDEYNDDSESIAASDFEASVLSDTESAAMGYTSDDPLIIVSLGDSYSSGEGIEPFFGQDKILEEKVKDQDWLAHRSKKSWPALLRVPGIEGTMADYRVQPGETSDAICQWYFVAASGATTDHLSRQQEKTYKQNWKKWNLPYESLPETGTVSDTVPLPPQLEVFSDDTKNKVDYVTLTIGGNDVGFEKIITICVLENSYLRAGSISILEYQLDKTWGNIEYIREKLRNAYIDIRAAAGEQASIIVAGYPELLNPKGAVIELEEAYLVNRSVIAFNYEIKKIVSECQDSGMDIYFVDVASKFLGHQAYSDRFLDLLNPLGWLLTPGVWSRGESWIRGIEIPPKRQDINHSKLNSDYTMHPNAKGAQAYAECVNETIKEIEENKNLIRIELTWGSTPEDLDAHLVGPASDGGKFHVYYSDEIYNDEVNLDVDEMDGNGRETITIQKINDGIYTYAVHNYSDKNDRYSNELAYSEAQVKVYRGSRLINVYDVPTEKDGTLWTVFSYDTSTQSFTAINDMTYESDGGDVLQGEIYIRSIPSENNSDGGIADADVTEQILNDIEQHEK